VIYVWGLVILVTSVVVMVTVAWWLGRGQPAQMPLAHLADPEPLPWERWYGPFPADTAPLLLLSESAAALVALEREITQMIADAEQKTRWLR
jgi:hypothetical protein